MAALKGGENGELVCIKICFKILNFSNEEREIKLYKQLALKLYTLFEEVSSKVSFSMSKLILR